MTIQQQMAHALAADEPLSCLRETAKELLAHGIARESLLTELELLRGTMQSEGREEEEDTILEVMDFLTGWASPHMVI